MLKKLTLSLCLVLSSLFSYASHLEGGELRYEFNGTNYTVFVKLYGPCGLYLGAQPTIVNFYSASCSDSFSRTLPLVSIDTLSDMYCPGTSVLCGTGYNPSVVITFSDTVSLDQCSDWSMSTVHVALNAAIDNMGPGPGSLSLFLQATLNNSAAINRNALIQNHPPFLLAANDWTTIPMQSVDVDGDSVTITLEELPQTPTYQQPFGSGYSTTNQLGTYTAFNNTTQHLDMITGTQSENMLVTKIREYRNGTEIGSYYRIWTSYVRPFLNSIAPMAAPGTDFTYTTCPGQTNTITINFADSTLTDSVFVDFYPPTLSGFTFASTTTTTAGSGSGTISWTTPTTVNVNATPYFIIPVRARDNRCPIQGYSYYGILVDLTQCGPDSVWAGDANADYTADMYDPLAIAVAYGTTGIVRPGATTTWQAEYCPNWGTMFNNGINHKHADCNGDGTIDNTDLAAVTTNYGQVHLKGGGAHAKSSAVPDLYFDLSGITFTPGATVTVPVKLGSTGNMANNVYGVATNISLQGITLTAVPTFNTTTSWLATTSNQLNFTNSSSSNSVDFVQARKDQQNASGQGTIATMTFTIPSSVTSGTALIFRLDMAKLIDNNGDDVAFNMVDDTAYIWATTVTAATSYNANAVIVPNPSKSGAYVQLTSDVSETATIVVTDVTGRIVYKTNATVEKGTQKLALPVVTPGMYEVRVQGSLSTKTLKWIQL
jgi:hypothetical protein